MARDRKKEESREARPADRRGSRSVFWRTLFLTAVFGVAAFTPLFGKLYAIQVRDHDFYQERAIGQQTRDNAVAANRGEITDINGKVLASSGTVYDVILSPSDFKKLLERWDAAFLDSEGNPRAGLKGYYPRPEAEKVAAGLAEILGIDPEKILKQLEKNSSYEIVSQRVEQEVNEEILQFIQDQHLANSVYTTPTSKRYYPHSSLAAQLIGWVNWKNDNKGAYGMEALYEEELAGETGRVVTAKDGSGAEMKYSFQDYYDATDGNNVTLTIDTTIQYYCERILEKGIEMFDVQDGGFVIAMDPNTGAIKAWANSPTYDLNDPWTVSDPVLNEYLESVKAAQAETGTVSDEEKQKAYNAALGNMQNRQWRNRSINDSYEPGSTFKSMVLAAALEEGVVTESDHFYCPGYVTVADRTINCSKKAPGHGDQDLAKAVANSCNPAFVAIGQRLGAEKFYDYLEDFGFLEQTGVDMQGEGKSQIWPRSLFTSANGITNLATASFGQRFQVTPLQLITAASSVINGGHLMQPYVMETITDADGNVLKHTEPTEVRQVISAETSQRCRTILESVVDGGTGKRAYVPGYRIGGKTGSSETIKEAGKEDPIVNKGDDYTIVSFLGFAPADDPQIVVLLAYNAPKPVAPGSNLTKDDYYISGGNMAALMAGELLEDILEYMGVEKSYTETERAFIDVTVPNLVGQTAQIGRDSVTNAGFKVRTVGEGDTVTAQIPVGGAVVPSGSEVVLYLGEEKPTDLVSVPDVRGKTAAQAQELLNQYGLYLKVGGSSRYMSSNAIVASQEISVGTSVERGTVVTCLFSDNTMTD